MLSLSGSKWRNYIILLFQILIVILKGETIGKDNDETVVDLVTSLLLVSHTSLSVENSVKLVSLVSIDWFLIDRLFVQIFFSVYILYLDLVENMEVFQFAHYQNNIIYSWLSLSRIRWDHEKNSSHP